MDFCTEFYAKTPEECYRAPQALIRHIEQSKKFKRFRSEVPLVKKFATNFDLFQPMKAGTLCFVNLLGSDGSTNHAVTIVNGYIFDSNLLNALPLTEQGLDDCAGESCKTVNTVFGYLFIPVD
jgi:hypothetical protein